MRRHKREYANHMAKLEDLADRLDRLRPLVYASGEWLPVNPLSRPLWRTLMQNIDYHRDSANHHWWWMKAIEEDTSFVRNVPWGAKKPVNRWRGN